MLSALNILQTMKYVSHSTDINRYISYIIYKTVNPCFV